MKHLILYFILSVLSAIFVLLPFVNEAPLNYTVVVLYGIFCSTVYTYVPKIKSVRKFIGIEILVVISWILFWIPTLKVDKDLAILSWVLSVNFISFLIVSIPTRFFSFLLLHFTLNAITSHRSITLRVFSFLLLVPCLYLIGEPLLKRKIRQEKNFVNSQAADNLLSRYMQAKKNDKKKCYDSLYEAADVTFIEEMFISSLLKERENYKLVRPISGIDENADPSQRIDITNPYEVADCFHLGKDKYYLLRAGKSEYTIKESDLDFSAKKIVTFKKKISEAFEQRDLDSFKSTLESRDFSSIPITSAIIEKDDLSFYKVIYEKESQRSLTEALALAKADSDILQFALSKPISMEQASGALNWKIHNGTAHEIKQLLQKGGRFNFDSGNQQLPILGVIHNRDNFREIIDLYLSNGGDINAKSARGESLFLRAETIEQVDYLLSKGAKLDDEDDDGRNLLLRLAQFQNAPNRFSVMKHLVDRGIDKKKLNSRGKSAYEILTENYCTRRQAPECKEIEHLK